ncbi:MAG: hypothetical protein Q4E17_03915, partial [Synergistes sp.]|nr:hypothetical protein [Synergistes sp.]
VKVKVKVRIKSLQIKNTHKKNKSHKFVASFAPIEKHDVCGRTFLCGIEGTGSDAKIVQFPSCMLEEIQITHGLTQDLFNFMSVNSEETFIITIEKDNNWGNVSLKEVKLIYD